MAFDTVYLHSDKPESVYDFQVIEMVVADRDQGRHVYSVVGTIGNDYVSTDIETESAEMIYGSLLSQPQMADGLAEKVRKLVETLCQEPSF